MQKTTARNDEVTPAVSAYLAASDAALSSAGRLNQAWRHYFESNGEEPSAEWVAQVAALQMTSEMALLHARAVAKEIASPSAVGKTQRRRRRENKFLATIGRPGQRLLRVALIIALVVSTLVATGAGISLALEIAGFLHLIDDPVQLPVGIQLAIFTAATGLVFGFRRVLKPVDRALYGSKGLRPKGFTL